MTAELPDPGVEALYIIDLHCFMHRFWATMGGRCAHGFTNFLGNLIRAQEPSHIVVCTDLPHPTFRHELAPTQYKAHREPPDATLLERLRWARELTEDAFGIPVIGRIRYEADDLIATLAQRAKSQSMPVVILALDKDLMQLVDDLCVMWDGKKRVVGPADVETKFGIRPDQLRDYLAIVGDTADSVPGVHGAGPAAAVEILREFQTLDYALEVACSAHGHPFFMRRPRWRQMLREQVKSVRLSQKLVTLAFDAPIDHKIEDLRFVDDE